MVRLILPADDLHPTRPNVPVLRHLTYDEIHAMQLGLAGLPIGAAYANGLTEIAVWFTVALLGIVFGVTQIVDAKLGTEDAEANLSRDIIASEPWYFLTSYFSWVGIGIVLATSILPPPILPELTNVLLPIPISALCASLSAFALGVITQA